MGAFSAFSFHGTKTLTTGGGMFLTNDAELYENVLTLSNHGRSRHQPKQFWADQVGFKFKMSNLQAAIGCAQLKRIDELIEKKRHIFMIYKGFSDQHEILSINKEEKGNQNGCWMPTIVFRKDTGISRSVAVILSEKVLMPGFSFGHSQLFLCSKQFWKLQLL